MEKLINYKEFQNIFYDLFEEMTKEKLHRENLSADYKLPFPNGNLISASEIWKVLKMRDILEPIGEVGDRELNPTHLFGPTAIDIDKSHKIITKHISFGIPESRMTQIISWMKHYLQKK